MKAPPGLPSGARGVIHEGVRYRALASDYDGTLATNGRLAGATVAALRRLRPSGRQLLMVTGRRVEDLLAVCPEVGAGLFDLVVAENGAVIYDPATGASRALGPASPAALVQALRVRGVDPLVLGRVIVATKQPHEIAAQQVIQSLGLDIQIIFNKGAVMLLPSGIDKATGLSWALGELGLSPQAVVGVGDAENDQAFLAACGYAVAVANALPALKQRADLVTAGRDGAGIVELVDRLVATDLAGLSPRPLSR